MIEPKLGSHKLSAVTREDVTRLRREYEDHPHKPMACWPPSVTSIQRRPSGVACPTKASTPAGTWQSTRRVRERLTSPANRWPGWGRCLTRWRPSTRTRFEPPSRSSNRVSAISPGWSRLGASRVGTSWTCPCPGTRTWSQLPS